MQQAREKRIVKSEKSVFLRKYINAYRFNAGMLQSCHCEAEGRGNLQHRSWSTDAPINIEHSGFTMLIGCLQKETAVLEIPTGPCPSE